MIEKNQEKTGQEKTGPVLSQEQQDAIKRLAEVSPERMKIQNAIGMSDQIAEGMYGKAYDFYKMGKFQYACQIFKILAQLNPEEPKYFLGLAGCYHNTKDYATAANNYKFCGMIDPSSPIPHYHASDCYIKMDEPLNAILCLEKAIDRCADNPQYQAIKDRSKLSIESLKKKLNLGAESKGEKSKGDKS
jgi:type III secretion system low calcium response chaperone LcrH/SycD